MVLFVDVVRVVRVVVVYFGEHVPAAGENVLAESSLLPYIHSTHLLTRIRTREYKSRRITEYA